MTSANLPMTRGHGQMKVAAGIKCRRVTVNKFNIYLTWTHTMYVCHHGSCSDLVCVRCQAITWINHDIHCNLGRYRRFESNRKIVNHNNAFKMVHATMSLAIWNVFNVSDDKGNNARICNTGIYVKWEYLKNVSAYIEVTIYINVWNLEFSLNILWVFMLASISRRKNK